MQIEPIFLGRAFRRVITQLFLSHRLTEEPSHWVVRPVRVCDIKWHHLHCVHKVLPTFRRDTLHLEGCWIRFMWMQHPPEPNVFTFRLQPLGPWRHRYCFPSKSHRWLSGDEGLYRAVILHSYTAQLYRAVIPRSYTAQLYRTVIPHSYTAQLYRTVIPRSYTAQLYRAVIPHSYTAQLYRTVIPHSYTAQGHSPRIAFDLHSTAEAVTHIKAQRTVILLFVSYECGNLCLTCRQKYNLRV
jgi:dihydrofolate reductase